MISSEMVKEVFSCSVQENILYPNGRAVLYVDEETCPGSDNHLSFLFMGLTRYY